jgi:mono/diheme cytochrome c family protein
MAGERNRVDEEKKSYSVVFLLAVGLLLMGAVWAVWDDNISRRPWKKYQVEFSELQIHRTEDALAKERQRLAKDPTYQKVVKDLAAARADVDSGKNAKRLAELERERVGAKQHADEEDLSLRIVKSKLEEAWYIYDQAILKGASKEEPHAHLKKLQEEKTKTEATYDKANAEVERIDKEMAEINSVVKELEDKKRDLEADESKIEQRLDGLVLKIGPFQLPKIPKIQQVVLHEFDRNAFNEPVSRVDRCHSCHAGIDKAGFEKDPNPFKTHPHRDILLGKHPVEKFGCTPCHAGQGAAVNSADMGHGDVKFWEHPLRRGDMVQSSCIGCHVDLRLPGAETIERGEFLFEQLGCHGCHLIEGYGELGRIGPYLRRIGAKAEPGWMVRWIENPHRFHPRTRMPNFMFDKDQATSIAAYLLAASKDESSAWLADHGPPSGIDPKNQAQVERGRNLANTLGCRGCHGFADNESPALIGASYPSAGAQRGGKDIAPNLAHIAEKTNARWIYYWLKNPRGYSPESRMPSLRLSDQEAADLTAYLLTLGKPEPASKELLAKLHSPETVKSGEVLVRKYGCFGCHNVPGMEKQARIGVELSTFGSKPLEELFFGDHTDIPHTWYDWTYNKLHSPRTYATERIEQVMPQFDLADEDIRALLVFLASRTDERVPQQYHTDTVERERALVEGRRLVAKYNCVGCHVIEQRGGAIRAFYKEAPTMAPPILNGEGAKVQPNWLFGFLERPVPLRPWLKLRMPTFSLTQEERSTIIKYFLAQEHVTVPFVHVDLASLPLAEVDAGRQLASPDYFNCFSCHQQGDKKPEGPQEGWAPDLTMAHERLNPDWILRWLRNPQALQPGTKMPAFYNFDDDVPDGPEDILGGNEEKQVEALRDFVLSLGAAKPAPPPPVTAAAPPIEPVGSVQGEQARAVAAEEKAQAISN